MPVAQPPRRIEVLAEAWIACPPGRVAAAFADEANWPCWWPMLSVAVLEQRGLSGVRWRVGAERASGTMEVWLEPGRGGVVVHWFLRLDPAGPLSPRRLATARARYARGGRVLLWNLKDELEGR